MMAQEQRKLFNQKKKEARDTAGKRIEDRVITLVADYSQNMYLPNFAGDQPGETYYYTPVNGYCFGVVDASTAPTNLTAHVYFEDVGKKGGDNVASLLWKQLKMLGVIGDDNSNEGGAPVKEINFVFDNCGGQNKNNMVLRILLLLIKRGHCITARAIFLVRGHTKNDCDRMFNLMKAVYRKHNIYNIRQFLDAIGGHPLVNPVEVKPKEFFEWRNSQNKYLKHLTNINPNHIFEVRAGDPNAMYLYEYNGAQPKRQLMVKNEYLEVDWACEFLKSLQPKPEVGIADIKWVELYDKWRVLIPMEHRTYRYVAEDPGPERRGKVKSHRKESVKQRSERSRSGASAGIKTAPTTEALETNEEAKSENPDLQTGYL